MKKIKNYDWINIEDEQPNMGEEIIGLTKVGVQKGSYISGNIYRVGKGRKSSSYNFTKWCKIDK